MKTPLKLAALAAAILMGRNAAMGAARDDMMALARYADQLSDHGIGGERFVELVDDRFWGLDPAVQQPGMGSYVHEMHARGLRGHALADAIVAEQRRRGSGVQLRSAPPEKFPGEVFPPMDHPPSKAD